jgi:hypothetical protein
MEVDDGEDEDGKPTKPSDPNDLSAYNLDDYDKEVSRGTGKSSPFARLGSTGPVRSKRQPVVYG